MVVRRRRARDRASRLPPLPDAGNPDVLRGVEYRIQPDFRLDSLAERPLAVARALSGGPAAHWRRRGAGRTSAGQPRAIRLGRRRLRALLAALAPCRRTPAHR